MKWRGLPAALVIVLAAGSACSDPPTNERQQADAAIAAARAADAATYAPTELNAATAALSQYEAAVAQRDYRQALNLALEARDDAYEALKHATDEKANQRAEWQRLETSTEALIKTANARLGGTSLPRPSPAAADHIRAAAKNATSALQEARTRVDGKDVRGAITALTPVSDALRKLLEPPPAPASTRKTH
jgi:hypothetical protein